MNGGCASNCSRPMAGPTDVDFWRTLQAETQGYDAFRRRVHGPRPGPHEMRHAILRVAIPAGAGAVGLARAGNRLRAGQLHATSGGPRTGGGDRCRARLHRRAPGEIRRQGQHGEPVPGCRVAGIRKAWRAPAGLGGVSECAGACPRRRRGTGAHARGAAGGRPGGADRSRVRVAVRADRREAGPLPAIQQEVVDKGRGASGISRRKRCGT